MIRSIVKFPNTALKGLSSPVQENEEVANIVQDMWDTLNASPGCVGLSAPQIGAQKRIVVLDGTRSKKKIESHGPLTLVNPRIDFLGDFSIGREGCLSIPDFTANVKRCMKIKISFSDKKQLQHELVMENFEAVIAQHEIDHLDGVLFLDRVASLKDDVFKRKV